MSALFDAIAREAKILCLHEMAMMEFRVLADDIHHRRYDAIPDAIPVEHRATLYSSKFPVHINMIIATLAWLDAVRIWAEAADIEIAARPSDEQLAAYMKARDVAPPAPPRRRPF